jgi:hypothetical protein
MKCLACSVNSHHTQSFRKENLLGFFAKADGDWLFNKLMRGNGKKKNNNNNIMQYMYYGICHANFISGFERTNVAHTYPLPPNQSKMRKLFFGESESTHSPGVGCVVVDAPPPCCWLISNEQPLTTISYACVSPMLYIYVCWTSVGRVSDWNLSM